MCEFDEKLIAWLDGELPALEAAEVGRHLESCVECRSSVEGYKRVSRELQTFCDAAVASSVRREALKWVAAASAAGTVAALLALLLVWPRVRVEPRELHVSQGVLQTASRPFPAVAETPGPPLFRAGEKTYRGHSGRRPKNFAENRNAPRIPAQKENIRPAMPNEPIFEIAIPAEDIFPPGAVPDGVNFVADVAIATDGSAERVRLRPRLAGFERRTTEP
jgi:hypothetical protein